MKIAKRLSRVEASGIREFFEMGRRIEDAIDLSIGQAHFDVPEPIQEVAIRAIRRGCGRYTPTQGDPGLVEATRAHAARRFGLPDSDELIMTVGATGALTLAMLALLDPGDEVLIPDPGFVMYRGLAQILGAVPVRYDLHPSFRLRFEELAGRVTERTRLVIVNTPGNPTGTVLTRDELGAVAELCCERGLALVSDELYADFCYDEPHVSIKEFPECESLLVGGFSKSHAMAGWRIGWAAGPPELIDAMRILQQFTYTCPPTPSQHASLAALETGVSEEVASYRRKRDLVHQSLVSTGYDVVRPTGAFYAYPRVPWGDDLAFCRRALEQKLIVVPGRAFSERTSHFRLSLAASDETLRRGLDVLARLVQPPA